MNVVLRLGVSALLIGAFLWIIGSADVLTRLRDARPGWVVAAIAFLVVQTVLMALRWRLVAKTLDLRFSRRWAIGEYFVAQMINYTLPGGVIGDGARAVRSKQGEDGLKRAAQAVVVERALGQLGLYAVLVAGVLWALIESDPLTLRPGVAGLGFLSLIAITLAGLVAYAVMREGRVVALMKRCLPNRRTRIRHIVLSVAAALMNVAAFTACALAVGITLPGGAILVVVPLILFAMIIPIGVAGWGWREGAAAALFPLAGECASGGIAAGILFGIALLLTNLPAIPLLLRNPRNAIEDAKTAARR